MLFLITSFLTFILLFTIIRVATYVGVIATILAIGIILLLEPRVEEILQLIIIAVMAYTCFELFFSIKKKKGALESVKGNESIVEFPQTFEDEVAVAGAPKQATKKELRVLLETRRFCFNQHIQNIGLGVSILGATGSGKTASPFYTIAKHFATTKCSGVLHDFKDLELTKITYPLFRDAGVPFHIFAPLHPEHSVRLNPIDPIYIPSEIQLKPLISSFLLNLTGKHSTDDATIYFTEGAASLLSAVIWRLKEDFPDKCNWPYVIAFLLNADHSKMVNGKVDDLGKLKDFVSANFDSKLLGAQFLHSQKNEKEAGSLFATLCSNLTKLADPVFFYLLSANDLYLNINAPDNRAVISFVNTPGVEQGMITPVIAGLVEICFQQMARHGNERSFIMLDEAPRIKLMELGSRVTTLRSYNISFVYVMQDIIQAKTQHNGKDFYVKEVLTSLNTQFLGKVNDPESAKYCESFFPMIKEKAQSKSTAAGDVFGSQKRTSTSEKDRRKVQAHEFVTLQAGEFYMLTGGKDKLVKFKNFSKEMKQELPPPIRTISQEQMREHKNRISQDAETCFYP